MKDFNQKWYINGSLVGILAGITIGWFIYAPKETETPDKFKKEISILKDENELLKTYIEDLQRENHILGSELAEKEFNK